MPKPGVQATQLWKVSAAGSQQKPDLLAVEEPLEIRLGFGPADQREQKSISVTMRTPGHDFELAAGFLFTEGLLTDLQQIKTIRYCVDAGRQEEVENIVRVELEASVVPELDKLERHFYTTSSCGVCGKTSIDAVETTSCFQLQAGVPQFPKKVIPLLPDTLRQQQNVFEHTGGLHAAALFNPAGEMELLREDVGRHNAVDKLVGAAFAQQKLPLQDQLLLVSGRASFELVQKAIMAGIPALAAVGAPSSLAVDLAKSAGMTLMGFVRQGTFNVYCGEERLIE